MYWIPAIFVFGEILFLIGIPSLMKVLAFNNFLKEITKEREKELRTERLKNWSNIVNSKQFDVELPKEKNTTIAGLYYLGLIIYFVVGLFYPIWWLSLIIFSMVIISVLISKIFKTSWECFLDLNDFNEELIPQKLERKIKLSEIDGNYKTQRIILLTKEYLFSLARLGVCVSIIVLHQYGML